MFIPFLEIFAILSVIICVMKVCVYMCVCVHTIVTHVFVHVFASCVLVCICDRIWEKRPLVINFTYHYIYTVGKRPRIVT